MTNESEPTVSNTPPADQPQGSQPHGLDTSAESPNQGSAHTVTNIGHESKGGRASAAAAVDEEITNNLRHTSDPRWPLLKAARYGGMAIGLVALISLLVWGGSKGMPGVWGVLIGAALGGGFVLLTVVSVLATSKTTPQATMAVVMGSWLLKVVVVLIVLAVLKGMDFYDKPALVITIILCLIVGLACETWGVLTARVSYIADLELEQERQSR